MTKEDHRRSGFAFNELQDANSQIGRRK